MDSLFPPDCPKVRIRILGEPFEVPAGHSLLRGFQFLAPVDVSRGRFCWNATCGNSSFAYRMPGDTADREGRACRVIAVEGMSVKRLSPELAWALRSVVPAPVCSMDVTDLCLGQKETHREPSQGNDYPGVDGLDLAL